MGQTVLHNIRILDFTWVLAGPYATRLLADYGAEVIKVMPVYAEPPPDAYERGYYKMWNRNKLSVTLNMQHPAGAELARKLVAVSDVVIENFAPRVMDNWGLSYPALQAVKPDIIMVRMSVTGQTGPQRDYAGFGPTVQAFSGLTGLTSFPGEPPLGPGFSYADHVAGLYASLAVLGALEHRHKTGEGQYIDLSQTEAMTSLLGGAVMEAARAKPVGNRSPAAAPHNVYRCRDGFCTITVFTDDEWQGFKAALGNPVWAEGFATLADRLENVAKLEALVAAWTEPQNVAAVVNQLQRHGVAAGAVNDAAALVNDPQLKSRGFFVGCGGTLADASPVRLPDSQPEYRREAPAPGQDNDYVYRELLGLSEAKLVELRRDGVI